MPWLASRSAKRKLFFEHEVEANGFVLIEELESDVCDNVDDKSLRPGLRDLERLLLALRGTLEIQLDFDMYDRYGAQHDTEEGRAEHAAVAARADRDGERLARELSDLVTRLRQDDATTIATWANLHITYLRALAFDAGSTEAFVRDEECAGWAAVARGELLYVKENVFYVKVDPALYANVFGFAPDHG